MKKISRIFAVCLGLLLVVALAACNNKTKYSAKDMVNLILLPEDKKTVTFDFEVPSKVTKDEQTVNVVWSSTDERMKFSTSGDKTIATPSYKEDKVDTPVTFTATVEVDGEKASKDFKIRSGKVSTFEEFLSTPKGQSVAVKGYVVYKGVYSTQYKNFPLYLVDQDKDGMAYYSYRTSCDQATYDKLEVGTYVGIDGKKDAYYGNQVSSGKLSILPGEKYASTDVLKITAENLATEKFVDTNTARLAQVEGVKVTDVVEYTGGSGKYIVKGTLGEETVEVVINKYLYAGEDESPEAVAIAEKLATVKFGDTITVKGYVGSNNGTLQLAPLSADDVTVTAQGDPNAAAMYKAKQTVTAALPKNEATIDKDTEFALPATAEGVNVTYKLDKEVTEVVLADGKLTVKPSATLQEVTLTATLTIGDLTETVTVKFSVKKSVARPETIDVTIGIIEQAENIKLSGKENYVEYFSGLEASDWQVDAKEQAKYKNPPAIKGKDLKLYSSPDQDGCSVTFTNNKNEKYQYVVLTLREDKGVGSTFTVNGVEYYCPAVESGKYVEVVIKLAEPTNSIVIKNNQKDTTTQVWISKIELAK